MTFKPTAPETKLVPITSTQDTPLDVYRVHNLEIIQKPNDPLQTVVKIIWSRGYNDGGGLYVPVDYYGPVELSGPALLGKLVEPVQEGRTVYEAVKYACWELLEAQGHIPAGSIE